jgi:D-inositol-3-phosphate glycosyltransferase
VRKLLWIGDAGVSTGFARATHHTLDVLRETWDVAVLGINYLGDPHPWPYPIYPCYPGGDGFGLGRTAELCGKLKPDLVVLQNDTWNIAEYLERIPARIPVVASMPVDGKNCRLGRYLHVLAKQRAEKGEAHADSLALAIFWTQFGLAEARAGGYEGPAAVIPLGVDLALYHPMDKAEARRSIGLDSLPPDAWIVGNVNRNQPRKRLDLTVQAFARWADLYGHDNAYLFLHVAPTGDVGYDCTQLMHYAGYAKERKRLILVEPAIGPGLDEAQMPVHYGCFDVQLTTTQGEGWGLTTMEGMACGIPQIVPDWAALGEWCGDAAYKIPCPTTAMTPNRINVLGGVPDIEEVILALERLYTDPFKRDRLRLRGLELVSRPEYRWREIGEAFAAAIETPYHESKVG